MFDGAPQPTERVLSTLEKDGRRRWLRPSPTSGRYTRWRRWLAVCLLALFAGLPFVRVAGEPAVLIDLPRRELTFFGSTLYATDTVLLMLALLGVFLGVFLVTALFGRAWCGWGCPQTVYMEFVFRPVERWLEGSRGQKAAKQPWRRWLKWGVFAGLSGVVAHVFLAWFVPIAELSQWVTRPPQEHPAGFAVVLVTSALVFFDFAWFREQLCVVACPYARLQSALLDRQSWIVAYDSARGEPRGKLHKSAPQQADHCVDCQACVRVCPTGIDIRDGLQLECISCTQCIDACDGVAKKLGRPAGLVRWTSQAELANPVARPKLLRTRTVLYPLALAVVAGLFVFALTRRGTAEVTLLRAIGSPFTVDAAGEVTNPIRLRVHNRSTAAHRYTLKALDVPELRLVAPELPLPVAAGEWRATTLFAVAPRAAIANGRRAVTFRIDDGQGFSSDHRFNLLGPGSR